MSKFILVVDDDRDIRESLCELLEDEGHRTIGAANGKEALEILRSGGLPCVILLDIMMPVMDGPTFRAAQLSDPGLRAIPVAIITAGGKDAANGLDAQALLLKPLLLEDVLDVVGRFCPADAS
jgi:CheY-like chemotaxis protein